MPELPEVQTIINLLNESKAINQTITSIDVFCPKLLKNCSVKTFQKQLVNEKITTISRIGKYLIFHLTNKKVLVIHLRMEGKLFYQVNACQTKSPHLHIQINFANHAALQYFDSRKFGTFHLFNESNYLKSPELSKIAYDPLNPECNAAYWTQQMQHCKLPIKSFLMDQTKIAGIGNIYANEILFATKIHPTTPVDKINLQQIAALVKSSKAILTEAIKYKGTTVFSYQFSKDHSGNYQHYLKVHGKNNQPCPICQTKIIKVKISGRGTYYCPHCQK